MAQLRQDFMKYVERDAEIIAIGPEDTDAFTTWWHEHEMPFTGVPDPKHKIAKLYSQKFKLFKGGRMPAMFVIDKNQMIRFTHFGESMSDIPTDNEILDLLDSLNKENVKS